MDMMRRRYPPWKLISHQLRIPMPPQLASLRHSIHSLVSGEIAAERAPTDWCFSNEAPVRSMELLQFCIENRSQRLGLSIHGRVVTNGFGLDVNLGTKLVIFYANFGRVGDARKVFDAMPERNVVSWTAMVSGYTRNGNFEDALRMFPEMRRAGAKGNQFTFGSVLRACTGLGCLEQGMQVQGCIHKSRFFGNLFVQCALVDLHSKCGSMRDACYLFERMSEKDVVSRNAMIGGYAAHGCVEESFQMLVSMIREGITPDCFTLGNVLKATSTPTSLDRVLQIHGFIIKLLGLESDTNFSGSLINAYTKCGRVRSAHLVYMTLQNKDLICCTTLLSGYAQQIEHSKEAMDLFKEIKEMHKSVDNVILCSMLNLCARMASLLGGRQIHALALKNSRPDLALGNALIDMYAKSGEIEDSNRAFDEMVQRNVISWTSLIAGYGKNGCGKEAMALYEKMESEDLKPNDVTFLSLLFACSHSGLATEGWQLFNAMIQKYNILPRAEHFSCIVDLLARGGRVEEAFDIISKLNIKPSASLWGAILWACSVYGNTSLGKVAATHLSNMDPENSVNFVVLSNIHAAAGAWDSVERTRRLLEESYLKKIPGCSLLHSV